MISDRPKDKKQREVEIDSKADEDADDDVLAETVNQNEEPELGFKIQFRSVTGKASEIEVHVRWIQGLDSALFESFYGMLRKNLTNAHSKDPVSWSLWLG